MFTQNDVSRLPCLSNRQHRAQHGPDDAEVVAWGIRHPVVPAFIFLS